MDSKITMVCSRRSHLKKTIVDCEKIRCNYNIIVLSFMRLFRYFLSKSYMYWSTLLVVQRLRVHAPNVGGMGSIPDQETKILHG